MPTAPQVNHTPQINKAYLLIALNLKLATAAELLENTGLSLLSLKDTDSIDVPVAVQAVHNLNKLSHNPNWPAVFGAHLGASSHGPVGYATLSAPTVGKALMAFVEWFQVRCETYSEQITQHDEYFEIIISDTTGDPFFEAFFFESLMRALEVLVGLLIGRVPTGETELHFITLATDRGHLLEEAYDSRLFFGSDANKLLVPKQLWFKPSPLYDKDSYEFNLRKCQQLLEDQDIQHRIELRIRQIIRKHFEKMVVSTHDSLPPPTQIEICKIVHLTERTLIRKLKENNTSYKYILEQERRKCAETLLKDARYTIYNVAEILGYREAANFCRAFKRWTKQTPTEYRRNPES